MFTIPLGFRLVFACIAAITGILAAIFGQALWQNIVYLITKRGRKPNPRPLRLWLAFIFSALATVLCGTIVTVVPTLDSPPPTQIAWVYVTPVGQSQIYSNTIPSNGIQPSVRCIDTGNSVKAIVWSPDGKTIITANDNALRVWMISTGNLKRTIEAKIGNIGSMALSPDGNTIVTHEGYFKDGHMVFYDVQTARIKHDISSDDFHATFSPDGKTFATANGDGIVRIWQLSDDVPLQLAEYPGSGKYLVVLAYSPDGKILATEEITGKINFWNLDEGKLLFTLQDHNYGDVIAFSPDGKVLAVGGSGGPIYLWSVLDKKELQILEGHLERVESISWTPDGRLLATGGGGDRSVRLWNSSSGNQVLLLEGHTGKVTSVSFSPNGKTLATASWDDKVCLWENIP